MKKLFVLLFSLTLLFTACGEKPADESSSENTDVQDTLVRTEEYDDQGRLIHETIDGDTNDWDITYSYDPKIIAEKRYEYGTCIKKVEEYDENDRLIKKSHYVDDELFGFSVYLYDEETGLIKTQFNASCNSPDILNIYIFDETGYQTECLTIDTGGLVVNGAAEVVGNIFDDYI